VISTKAVRVAMAFIIARW